MVLDPSWPAKRFRGRFHQGPPRLKFFNSGSSNVAQISWCLADPFWGAKKVCGRFLSVLETCLPVPHLFLASFLTALAWGSSAIVKSLGQNDIFVFLGSLQQMDFFGALVSPAVLLGKWLLLQKRLRGGFRQILFTLSPKWLLLHKRFFGGFRWQCFTFVSFPGVKDAWIGHMSHPYKFSPQKITHHVVAVGVFFGFILYINLLKNRMADVWQTLWHECFVGNSACWHFGFQVCANLRWNWPIASNENHHPKVKNPWDKVKTSLNLWFLVPVWHAFGVWW